MGLGANEDGHCSTCDVYHLRPWGTQCLSYKNALQKCQDLNIDVTEYRKYLDRNLVRYAKDLPPDPSATGVKKGEVKDEEVEDLYRQQIKQLTEINLQQKAQIEALVQSQQSPPHRPKDTSDNSRVLQQIMDRLELLESGKADQVPAPREGAGVLSAAAAVGSASKVSDSPAVAAMGQMADAMAQLSLSIDPSSGSKSGQLLRPEYHYCVLEKGMPLKSADATKLSINEYLYGMCVVLEHLIEVNGSWKSYFSHYKRIMKFFVGKKYINSAYISYDKEVVDCFLKHPSAGFNSSDTLAIPTHFCSANEHDTYNSRPTRGFGRRGRRGGPNISASISSSVPEDWPDDVCHTAYCVGNCNKQHVCAKCRIRGHKMGNCRVNIEKN